MAYQIEDLNLAQLKRMKRRTQEMIRTAKSTLDRWLARGVETNLIEETKKLIAQYEAQALTIKKLITEKETSIMKT